MIKTGESYIKKIIEDGARMDGRKFDQFREIKIRTNVISSAEGSAEVFLGGTHIIAGVKLEVIVPYPDTPDEGSLIVDVEFIPMANPEFESGPPDENAVEVARVVDRGIRESKSIDVKKLCISEKEHVWSVHIDIHVLDHDGNLIDAAFLAAISALLTTKFLKWDAESKKIVREKTEEFLPLVDVPMEVTVAKIAGELLIDPTIEEEEALEARITIGTNKEGKLCAIQKGGRGFFSVAEVEQAADLAIAKGNELREILRKALA
ncbi:MAG TPA: exosome complex protein Rrp42 [archaeon]|nr:exosome complex protein Rrp42 [archaeon]